MLTNLSAIKNYFEQIYALQSNPIVLIGLVFGSLACVFSISKETWRPWVLGILFFLSMCAPATDFYQEWIRPPFPYDYLVLYSRPIVAGMLAIITLTQFTIQKKTITQICKPATWMLILQLAFCARLATSGNYSESIMRATIFATVYTCIAIQISSQIVDLDSLRSYTRSLCIALGIYVAISLIFIATNYQAGAEHGRWFGVTGNANHNAMAISIFLPATLALMSTQAETKSWRTAWLIVAAGSMIPLFLSGSRGGILTTAIGLLFFYRLKFGKLIFALIPLSIVAYSTSLFFESETNVFKRYTTGASTDTRTYVWQQMISDWLANPIFGSAGSFGVAENAYLGTLQRLGLVGLALMMIVGYTTISKMISSAKNRKNVGPFAPISDAGIAGLCAIGANSMFEATFFSNLNQTIFALYFYFIIIEKTSSLSNTKTQLQ